MIIADSLTNTTTTRFPTFWEMRVRVVESEQHAGWMASCVDAEVYLVCCRQLVDALQLRLSSAPCPLVEVCSGCVRLAVALRDCGVGIVATDIVPQSGKGVRVLSAQKAIDYYKPRTVLACFRPIDAGVDEAVMSSSSVTDYFVLQSRHNGGQFHRFSDRGWHIEHVDDVAHWMITRDDVWIPNRENEVLQRGEAWHLHRA